MKHASPSPRASRIFIPALALGLMLALGLGVGPLYAQVRPQLSTVAIFNLDQVLLSFYQDSAAVREYRQAELRYRDSLARLEQRLQDLQARRNTALSRNDSRTAASLRSEIEVVQDEVILMQEQWYQRSADLRAELVTDRFWSALYDAVNFVAMDGGYTLVLEETQLGTALFWFSPSIEITQTVIRELVTRFR